MFPGIRDRRCCGVMLLCVTLIAAGVPLRDVLAAWTRAGDTRFVGAEALGAAPVSLHLAGVAEAEALRLLLQPAAGYLAARRAPSLPGASVYDRVRIRAERRAPRPAPARPAAPEPSGGGTAASPTLSESDQRERLQRLMPPVVASGEAATGPGGAAARRRPRASAGRHPAPRHDRRIAAARAGVAVRWQPTGRRWERVGPPDGPMREPVVLTGLPLALRQR